jgi:Uma2 family endonuclease
MTDPKQATPKSPGPGHRSTRLPSAPIPYDLAVQAGAPVDWSAWSVDEADHAAESCEQGAIIRELVSTLENLARVRAWARVYIGADNYFAWMPERPEVRVSPDVYLLDDPPSPPMPKSWQTWKPGHRPPRWAVEVVSEAWSKDYEDGPVKYSLLGCAELVLFDPEVVLGFVRNQKRVPLSVFRRDGDGKLAAVYAGKGPAFSEELGCWLVARREGYVARLRLSEDKDGERPIPTRVEAEAAARVREVAAETARARAEAARAREAEAALARETKGRAEAEERAHALEERLRRLELEKG